MGALDRYYERKKKNSVNYASGVSALDRFNERQRYNSIDTTGVDQKYIDTFITDANTFLTTAEKDYGGLGWGTAASAYEGRNASWQDLNTRADTISAWLYKNRDRLDTEAYNNLGNAISEIRSGGSSVLDAFKGARDLYASFDTEDAYNTWYDNHKRQEEEKAAVLSAADFEEYFNKANADGEMPTIWEKLKGDTDYNSVANMRNDPDMLKLYEESAESANGASWGTVERRVLDDLKYKAAKWMNDDEFKMYSYYYGKDMETGTDTAMRFLESIEETLNKRAADARFAELEGRTFAELVFGVEAGLDQFETGLLNLGDDRSYIPASPTQMASGMVRDDLADNGPKLPDWMGGASLGQMGYDTVTTTSNMLPSILTSAAANFLVPGSGAIIGAGLMGTSASGHAYTEMLNLGYDKGQARAYSLFVGASEAALQYALGGIGKLGGKLSGNAIAKFVGQFDNAIARAAIKLGGNMLSEGLEESLQSVLEPVFKSITTGEEFEGIAWDEVLYSGIMGAVSAGILEGGGTVLGEVQTYAQGKALKSAGTESIDRLVGLGQTFSADTVAYQLAGKVDANTGAYTIGRLLNEVGASLSEQNKADIAKALEAKGMTSKDANTISKWLGKAVDGAYFNKRQIAALDSNEIISSVFKDVIVDQNSTVNQRIQGYNDTLRNLAEQKARGKNAKPGVAQQEEGSPVGETAPVGENTPAADTAPAVHRGSEISFETSETGKTILKDAQGNERDTQVKRIASTEGGIKVELESGETVNASDLSFGTKEEALMYEMVARMEATPETANEIISTYKPNDLLQATLFFSSVPLAYQYGKMGYEAGLNNVTLPGGLEKIAYNRGRMDAMLQDTAKTKTAKKDGTGVTTKKGGIFFEDGYVYDESKANGLQKASMAGIEAIDKMSNLEVHVFESKVITVNGRQKRVCYINGKMKSAPNGYFTDGNKIYIDINAGNGGEGAMLYTASHEIGHYIREWNAKGFRELGDFLMEQYGKKGVSVQALLEAQKNKVRNRYREERKALPSEAKLADIAYEELVCDAMSDMFTDPKAYEKLAKLKQQNLTLWQKLGEAIKALLDKLKTVLGVYKERDVAVAQEAHLARDFTQEVYDKIQDLYLKAFVEADANYAASTESGLVEIDTKSESVAPIMHSERTWTESEYVVHRDQMAKKIAKALSVTVKKAQSYIDDINSIARMIANDRARLDYEASSFGSAFVSNVEYGGSFDYTTLCKKRRIYTGTFSEIQKRLHDVALTPDDILKIRNLMIEEGIEATCGLCYVEGSRANMGKFAKKFIELYKRDNPDAWIPTMADVNTPDGVEQMRINHPEAYESYEYFWNHYGKLQDSDKALFASQQKPKLYEARKEYKGEILEHFKGDSSVAKKNLNGGIRMQSFSDFEIVHLIDTMQVIMDMSTVGLAGQAYTKVPEFARAFGNTGLKINLSLIAKGVDADGNLIFDDREGMPHDTAFELRDKYSKNVGTIIVTFTDEQLLAAMADPRIDFIIPFHRSQWKKGQYGAMGLPKGTKDYTFMQNEKFITPTYHKYQGRMVKDKATNYMPNEYWDFSKSGKENAEAYLKMCAENNKRPKFYKLLDYDGNGTYSLKADGSTDGYWKLLIDFKMYDNAGVGSPQMPVTPTFNMDEARTMLDEYKGGHGKYPVASGVVDKFVSEYNEENNTKYSDRDSDYLDAVNRGDMVAAQRMVDEAAKEAGYTIEGSHGTLSYFTIFDRSFGNPEGDWGKGFYFTNNEDDAEINYASADGADLQAKIEKYAQQLEWTEEYGDLDFDERIEVARKELTKGDPRVIKAYLKMDNPVVVGGQNETYFDFTEDYNEETEEYGDPTGKLVEFVAALSSILEDYAANGALDADNVNVYELFEDGDGYTASQLEKAACRLLENVTDENGDYATKEIIRAAFEEIGFDGIVDNTVAGKFGDRSGRINHMVGVTLGTTHYIAFKSSQIKQSDPVTYDDNGNVIPLSKRFNAEDSDIRYSDRDHFAEDKYFRSQMAKWEDLKHGAYVKVGQIGKKHPLYAVGMPEGVLRYDVDKLKKNMADHSNYLSVQLLTAIPDIIAHPVAISEYSEENTVSVFGDVFVGNSPMMVGVTISKDRSGNDINKVRTFNARKDVGKLITDDSVLYLDENKKRTRQWFQACGIQVPLGETKFGFIRSISQKADSVKDNTQKSPKFSERDSYAPVFYSHSGDVWSMDITDSMKNSVLYEGQVLYSLRDVDPVEPASDKWQRTLTTSEVKAMFPDLWDVSADESEVRNPTQISGTVKSYRKVYDFLKKSGFKGTILDASSGLGYGTRAGIEEYGFDVEDIEPYPDKSYTPKYTDYSALDKKYDAIISNAVLNVLPQDQRDALVVKMGELLKVGGRMFINVRGDDVKNASSKVAINEDLMEYYISKSGSYQKGFTKAELVAYLQDALGDGFTVAPTTFFGKASAVVTKVAEQPRYSDRDTDSVSNRTLLAGALESVAQNDIEKSKLNQYKAKIAQVESEQKRLTEIRAKANGLRFTKGRTAEETKQMRDLDAEATKIANRISTYDKQLLNLEATTALKNVLEREKANLRKDLEAKGRKALSEQRQKNAEAVRGIVSHYQESRKKAVEGRYKTEMRHKIQKAARDLDAILNRGTKDRNVKKGEAEIVRRALDLSDMLFAPDDDLLLRGLEVDLSDAEEAAIAEYKKLYEEYHSYDAAVTENKETRAELRKQMNEVKKGFAEAIERERKRISQAKASATFDALIAEYKKLEGAEEDHLKLAYKPEVVAHIEALKSDVGDTLVSEMTLGQLEQVYKAFTMIKTMVTDSNKIWRNGKKESMEERRGAIFSQIGSLKNRFSKDHSEIMGKVLERLNEFGWNNLRPVDAFEMIGSEALTELFWDVIDAQSVYAKDVEEAKAKIVEARQKYGYKKWKINETKSFKMPDGRTFKVTLGEMMAIYAYSKRNQADAHMREGGFQHVKGATYKDGKVTKLRSNELLTYKVGDSLRLEIINALTKEQQAYAAEMQALLTSWGEKGNEASRILYGIDLFNEEVYFPLMSSHDYLSSVSTEIGQTATTASLAGAGMTKPTKPKAKNPIILQAFDDVLLEHIDRMSKYHAYVVVIDNLRKMLDAQGIDMNDNMVSIKALIGEKLGNGAKDYLQNYITDLNGSASISGAKNPLESFFSKAKGASVAANLSVWVQQYFSIIRAFTEVNPRYFMPFIGKQYTEGDTKVYEEMKKYAPIATIKEMGGFDVGSNRGLKEYAGFEEAGVTKDKVSKKMQDAFGIGATLMDKLGWITIWKAVKKEVAASGKYKEGSKEYFEACGKRFEEVIVKTQVYDSVNARSGYMRSKNAAVKYLVSFMGEPTTIVGMAEVSFVKFARAVASKNKEAIKKASGGLVGTMAAIAVSTAMTSVAKSLVYAMRDDDEDETYLEKYAEALGGAFRDDLNLLGYFPIARDISSIFEGRTIERPDMTLIEDMIDSYLNLMDSLGDEDATVEDKVSEGFKLAGAIANIFGIPAKNIWRDLSGLVNTLTGIGNGYGSNAGKSFAEGWTGEEAKKGDNLYSAIVSGDTARVEHYRSTYTTDTAYNSAVRKALRDNDPRIKEAAEAKLNGDSAKAARIAEEIERDGYFKKEDIKAAINSEVNELKGDDDTSKDEATEDKDEAVSWYDASDINAAFEDGDNSMALEIIRDLIDTKVANGKTDKEAKSSLRSSMTSYWKPLYKQAYQSGDAAEMLRIRKILFASGLYGSSSEVVETVRSWLKN